MASITTLSSKQIASLIKVVGPTRTVLVRGEFGIGKTSIFYALQKDPAFANYISTKPIDCTQLSDGSVWMPDIDRTRGVSRELPNERFGVNDENHNGIEGARPWLGCLDEVAKTRQFIKDVLAPIIYERRLGSHEFPKGSVLFATTNLAEEGLGDTLQGHLANRLIQVNMRKPTKDEWVNDFAVPNALAPELIAACEQRPQVFDSFLDYKQGGKFANQQLSKHNAFIHNPTLGTADPVVTPRSLHAASDIIAVRSGMDDETLSAALQGTVGDPFTAEIMAMLRFGDTLPSFERIVQDPAGVPLPSNPAAQIVQVFQFLTLVNAREEAESVSEYVSRMREEMKSVFINSVAKSARVDKFAVSGLFTKLMLENKKFMGA